MSVSTTELSMPMSTYRLLSRRIQDSRSAAGSGLLLYSIAMTMVLAILDHGYQLRLFRAQASYLSEVACVEKQREQWTAADRAVEKLCLAVAPGTQTSAVTRLTSWGTQSHLSVFERMTKYKIQA